MEKGVPALGPYPSRGEYEHCMTLETPNGGFVQLTPTVVEYVARAIEFSRKHKPKKSKLYAREAKNDEDYITWAMDRMDDNATWSYTPHSYGGLKGEAHEQHGTNA